MGSYYVAPSGGSNANPGTFAQPWATWAYGVANLAAGDTLYLMDGTHSVTPTVTDFDSGTAGNLITIAAINNRAATLSINDNGRLAQLTTESYITFDGLVFDGYTMTTSLALIECRTNCTNIVFSDCEFKDSQAHLLYINGSSVTVTGCDFHKEIASPTTSLDCINVTGSGAVASISTCNFYHFTHVGISCDGGTTTIDGCDIYDGKSHCTSFGDPTLTAATVTMTNTTLRGAGMWNGTDAGKSAIHINSKIGTVTVSRCPMYGCAGPALQIVDQDGTLKFYHNVLYDNQKLAMTSTYNWGSVMVTHDGTTITPGTVEIKNCIIVATNTDADCDYMLYVRAGGGASLTGKVTLDYNDWYWGAGVNHTFRFLGTSYTTWAAYQAAGYEANSINADPLFYNQASYDFHLTGSSPCLNEGVAIAGINDGYVGAAPDIGIYEYAVVTGLVWTGFPATAQTATNLSTFTVKAVYYDGSTATGYTTDIVLSKQSGPGTLSGTTTRTPSSGVSTFNDIQLSAAGTVTLLATSGSFTQASTAIEITSSTPPVESAPANTRLPAALKARMERKVGYRR